jgi:hypothetical protein
MNWAEHYRRYAAESLRLAQQAPTDREKALLLEIAQRWQLLSEHAEQDQIKD